MVVFHFHNPLSSSSTTILNQSHQEKGINPILYPFSSSHPLFISWQFTCYSKSKRNERKQKGFHHSIICCCWVECWMFKNRESVCVAERTISRCSLKCQVYYQSQIVSCVCWMNFGMSSFGCFGKWKWWYLARLCWWFGCFIHLNKHKHTTHRSWKGFCEEGIWNVWKGVCDEKRGYSSKTRHFSKTAPNHQSSKTPPFKKRNQNQVPNDVLDPLYLSKWLLCLIQVHQPMHFFLNHQSCFSWNENEMMIMSISFNTINTLSGSNEWGMNCSSMLLTVMLLLNNKSCWSWNE